jgi:hypothetical protein
MAARDDVDLSRATWRTSTYSGNGNDCVEVAAAWRTSSHSNDGGACVDAATAWRTTSHSNAGGNCVEAGQVRGAVLVRDTKQHGRGRVHRFTAAEWREFIARIKASETAR